MSEHEITFEAAHYSADAIQRAVYKLSDRLSCDLASDGTLYRCTLRTLNDTGADAGLLVEHFRNEVLDETLRERVREETREVRNLILALAFSNTGLVDPADA